MTDFIRALVSKEKCRYQDDDFDLDLSYVTKRLIAMGFPSNHFEGIYRNRMSDVKRFFATKHPGHYKVYNLCSERSYSAKHFLNATASFPFDDHNPCPFQLLIKFCEDAQAYLDLDPANIIAVHCKAGKGRTGLVLCCYLQYSKECLSSQQALDFYAENRTKNGKGVTIPSQVRWVHHFGTFLRQFKWPDPPRPFPVHGNLIVITHLEIHGYPLHLPSQNSPEFKVSLMNNILVWDSKQHPSQVPRWHKAAAFYRVDFDAPGGVQVAGDFNISCKASGDKIFALWDHSTFLPRGEAKGDTTSFLSTYRKAHLDGPPCKDMKKHLRYDKDFHVVVGWRLHQEVAPEEKDELGVPEERPPKGGFVLVNPLKKLVSKKKLRFQKDGFDLDLSYITPNIIAMGFPSEHLEGVYRNSMTDVVRFLKFYHEDHYKVYNLCSERTYNPKHFNNSTASYPFDDHSPCPFKMLVKFCQDAAEFLARDSRNCAVVHCKAGKGRTGLVIASLLLHVQHCGSAEQALELYGRYRTSNIKGVTIPSQQRYVMYYDEYFHYAKLGRPFPSSAPEIKIIGFHLDPVIEFSGGGCTPHFTITSDKASYNYKTAQGGRLQKWNRGMPSWCRSCNVDVRGDVHVIFYDNEAKMFGFWLNTSFITSETIVLRKEELDKAAQDRRHTVFAENFKIQISFAGVPEDSGLVSRRRTLALHQTTSPVANASLLHMAAEKTAENGVEDIEEEYSSTSEELSDEEYPGESDEESARNEMMAAEAATKGHKERMMVLTEELAQQDFSGASPLRAHHEATGAEGRNDTIEQSDKLLLKLEQAAAQIGARLSDPRSDWDKIIHSCGMFTTEEQGLVLQRINAMHNPS